MVYQDLALVEPQDISTNLNMGQEKLRRGPLGWLGFVDRKAMRRSSEAELDRLGVRTAPMTRPVEMLSGGQRQVVALARSAIRVNGESQGILLLDEPTAALGYEQTKNVEALIRRMADQGIAIVIVTHDLPLCYEVADRIVILNRGRKVADVPAAGDRPRPRRRLDHRLPAVHVRRPGGGLSHGRSTPSVADAVPPARGHQLAPGGDGRPGARPAGPRVHGAAARARSRSGTDPRPHRRRAARPGAGARVRPTSAGTGRPALLWLHGGAFMFGDLDMPEADWTAREICARAGAVVVSVDYRLAVGGVHHPVPLDDCVAATRWLRDHAAELGVDPDRISVGGASAGGNLATATVLRLRDEDGWQPAALIPVYPVLHAALPGRRRAEVAALLDEVPPAAPVHPGGHGRASTPTTSAAPSRPTATPSPPSPT